MAARRLLIVVLVLLGVSTLAAALIPQEARRGGTSSETTEARRLPPDTVPSGELLTVTIQVGGEERPVVPLEVGDQLELLVRTSEVEQVAIPALGLLETAEPLAPARFDILATEAGSYPIRLVDSDRIVARLEVSEPEGDARSGSPRADDGPGLPRPAEPAP